MNSNGRGIAITCGMLFIAVILCGVFVFLLAGPQIIDVVRVTVGRWQLDGRADELNAPLSSDTTPVLFTVASGQSPYDIALQLAAQNLISDAQLFFDYVRYEGFDTQINAGTYYLNRALNIPQVVQRLSDANFQAVPVRVLDGWRIEEVADSIDVNPRLAFTGQDFLALVRAGAVVDAEFAAAVGLPAGASLEGFLYPTTYQVPPDAPASYLRDMMLDAFRTNVINVVGTQQTRSLYEIVTVASIVRREAVQNDEMPLIAGVYLNRLNIGMKLDADPTVQYGLDKSRGEWWPRITQADYQGVASPYNTYRINGLPPGPIANIGIGAIQAVITPTPSEYYFFRADCRTDGFHDFARTYEEHLANGC